MDPVDVTVRVVIVDDDDLVLTALRTILEAKGLQVVGECKDGDEVPAIVAKTRPDVVVMDLRMPRVGGIEATKQLQRVAGSPGVLALTSLDTESAVIDAINAGAKGFISKSAAPDEIAHAVKLVATGEGALSPWAARVLITQARNTATPGSVPALSSLSAREREVALAVARGLSNAQIARELHVSEATVKTQLSAAMNKLDVENRVQLAVAVTRSAGPGT